MCEIATFRGSRETAIQFSFFGKFRTGRAIFFRQPLNSLSVRFVLGKLPVRFHFLDYIPFLQEKDRFGVKSSNKTPTKTGQISYALGMSNLGSENGGGGAP